MPTRSSIHRDANQAAKSILDQATGESPIEDPPIVVKNEAAVTLGRLGGRKGGTARAQALSAERKTDIARQAARARWATKK